MTITIGVHASNPSLYHLYHLTRHGFAQQELEPLGESVAFHPYSNGVRTGELLSRGVIDFGGTGSTPPVTAQAAGHDLVYTAVSAPRPEHGALLVPEDSPLRTAADLKGRTVHLAIGSWQTHLIAKALDDAGLSYADDITAERSTENSEQLLRTGAVAAWVAQGPQLAAARRTGGLRTLIRTGDVITDRSVFFTRRALAEERPEIIDALTRALRRADDWAAAHPRDAARIASADLGGTVEDWESALSALPWRIEEVGDAFLAEQQEAADIFHRTGFIERPVTVAHAVAHAPAKAV
ncbi:ABC transporter substrate-binding protein [Streptomyces sp. ARC12]|uniref:ABC transporter substrate-binding protein n=1 Tax=Streptomyces TaxID=1883 RepID=UPI00067CE0D9|nr:MULTISPECIES: ABC transporter substrate-binding protein [Streptomyces]KND25075.1 sulfonate ABC transporter substrate-binding protein [Streptomyces europaeiscabiei]MDF9807984.1 sulfonate transport system substrate-binding protein [Streptomyces sp. HB372]OKI78764.1 sulfonate ABC transporter substrate-binding protein [Streptomyces sp. TSRI0395]WTC75053.1 ABC transporter substrate-binding protein [Streptomyces anulatus]WUD87560.1 ABC transporter substrate-binding protein [Streptomyces anulatus]